jgi:hypothetical protein
VTNHIVAVGLLLNLYIDREICVSMRDVGGFFLSDMHSLLFFCCHQIVASWVEALDVSARSWPVGPGPTLVEGRTNY